MWFHIDHDRGASYWDNGRCYEDLIHLNIWLLPSTLGREEEIEMITKLNSGSITKGKRDTFFLLSRHWYNKWVKYVFAPTQGFLLHPKEINNYGLLVQNEMYSLQEACINCILKNKIKVEYNSLPKDIADHLEEVSAVGGVDFFKKKSKQWTLTLKPTLIEKDDYIKIPQEYWQKILAHYGGGPSLPAETEQMEVPADVLTEILSMGFDVDVALHALRIHDNNLEQAVNYLLS